VQAAGAPRRYVVAVMPLAAPRLPAAPPDGASLPYRPPYDWDALLAFLAARATPGVESAADGRYRRTVRVGGHVGTVTVAPARGDALAVGTSPSLRPALGALLPRLRRLLDLDADPAAIGAHLATDPTLAPLVRRRPGLRVPGTLDGFDLAVRAILGQQVSVRGATTLAGRLAARFGDPVPLAPGDDASPLATLAVTAERLADAGIDGVAGIGLPRARAAALVALARAVADGALPELDDPRPDMSADVARRLAELPGIGPWTAEYVAMRALRDPDAFPDGDLALRRALGDPPPAALRRASDRWRPWRAYAAMHLWASLGESPTSSITTPAGQSSSDEPHTSDT
jgi:AraC family transcriptional regulator, regulatory protein of adaptative response / DNA-3-methyladenine glycosylase II